MLGVSRVSDKRISFLEAVEEIGVSRTLARGFQQHCRLHHDFNFRTPDEWRTIYSAFAVQDRRRGR